MGSAHDTTHAGSLRLLLRRETAADHLDVDRRFSRLIEEGAAGYRQFLLLAAAAVWPLERALLQADIECILPDWGERSRSAALRADLAELGIAEVPRVHPPSLIGEAYKLGVLYVLEGSRLGAKTLIRRLVNDPQFSSPQALRYLRHGDGRPLWQTFLSKLESSQAARRSPEDAVAGAVAAFACFKEHAPDRQTKIREQA